jgi:hypothetical protein
MKWLLSLALLAALPVDALGKDDLAKYAGVYNGETHPKRETREQSSDGSTSGTRHRTVTLSLGRDGTATLTQSPDGTHEITSFAHWSHDGDTVKLNFDPIDQQATPPPMSFRLEHKKLTPLVWNHDLWRSLPPPTLHRSGSAGKDNDE